MTRKLEELFNLPPASEPVSETISTEEIKYEIQQIDADTDKIDAALPAVLDLTASDADMDDIANRALEAFESISDLAFNVDSRFSAELHGVAKGMLDTAKDAKLAKMEKRLKQVDLQLKKANLDLNRQKLEWAKQQKAGGDEGFIQGEGTMLTRNDLLEMIKGPRDATDNSNKTS